MNYIIKNKNMCCNREMYFSVGGWHCSVCGYSKSLEQIKNNINISCSILDDNEMNLKDKINEEWKAKTRGKLPN